MPLSFARRLHGEAAHLPPNFAPDFAPDLAPDLANDEAARVRLAARPSTPATVLRALADDPAITVRAAVAMNPAYAPAADRRLLSDTDDRVRSLLAGKIAALLPTLTGPEHAAAQAHVHRTLVALAHDAAIRVRLTIAEALHATPEAPREVILALANDPVLAVSDPVLRLSPLLSDADLLELLATPPHDSTALAVASRVGLSAAVSDRIAQQADRHAVRALLMNQSASIQEATLDALIGRAGDHPEWHEPLVCRPTLPERAARSLARIVAGHILQALLDRADLPCALAEELRAALGPGFDQPDPPAAPDETLDSVRHLAEAGLLTEQSLHDAAAAGDDDRVAAILATASGATLPMVGRAIALRSAKALVSLTWRAGFTMHAASIVQSALGQLGPHEQLAAGALAAFPLSPEEMDWQIELLEEPGR